MGGILIDFEIKVQCSFGIRPPAFFLAQQLYFFNNSLALLWYPASGVFCFMVPPKHMCLTQVLCSFGIRPLAFFSGSNKNVCLDKGPVLLWYPASGVFSGSNFTLVSIKVLRSLGKWPPAFCLAKTRVLN